MYVWRRSRQLCNVIGLDKKHDDVIIHAGNNEIANTESLPEFVYTVSKTAEKLKKISSDTNITMVLPCAPTTGPHEIAKAEYFEEKIREIDDIKVVKVDNIEYDGTHHPTEKGTAQIIEQIQAAVEEKIVVIPESIHQICVLRVKTKHRQAIYNI